MDRRWLMGVAALAVIAAGLVGWRAWPRDPGPVAPPVTTRELRQVDHAEEGGLTLVGGGSRTQAHRLWAHYHDRPAFRGVKPRLLGISRVRLTGASWDGVYWLVLSDHVYQFSFGPDADAGGYGLEAVFVPDGSESYGGNTLDF